jgi:hypothetical protein
MEEVLSSCQLSMKTNESSDLKHGCADVLVLMLCSVLYNQSKGDERHLRVIIIVQKDDVE